MKVLLALAFVLGAGSTSAVHLRERRLGVLAAGGTKGACVAFFDQGGGSFTGFLFDSEDSEELVKVKSKDMVVKGHKIGDAQFLLTNPKKGTFEDYSTQDEDTLKGVTKALADYYKQAVDIMLNKLKDKFKDGHPCITTTGGSPPPYPGVIVRQTGKIRAVLLPGGDRTALKGKWDGWMRADLRQAFGMECNYDLLTNQKESNLEGNDFFVKKWDEFYKKVKVDKAKVLALGVGSSSTQAYYFVTDEGVQANGDSELGAMPTDNQITEGLKLQGEALTAEALHKVMPTFTDKFKALFGTPSGASGRTLVAMNAIGYAVQGCLELNVENGSGTAKTMIPKVKTHGLITPKDLLVEAKFCFEKALAKLKTLQDKKERKKTFTLAYQADLLKGFAEAADPALTAGGTPLDPASAGLILECKFDSRIKPKDDCCKCAIPGGAGWVRPLMSETLYQSMV